jgi:pyridoxine 5-phosphate synthase
MTKLSVNVNKLATLRNSRGKNRPDVQAWAARLLTWGAQGITVHPRPDGRHIRLSDVAPLKALVDRFPLAEFNIEGYPSADFLTMVGRIKPHQVTLVPDPPDTLTSNAGWDFVGGRDALVPALATLRAHGLRSSLFLDPWTFRAAEQRDALLKLKPDRVELYTERFADDFGTDRESATLALYQESALWCVRQGIAVNAGHDLDLHNLKTLVRAMPDLAEVSIGHALICDGLEWGLETTLKRYLDVLAS